MADLSNAIVRLVSTRPLISKSSSLFTISLVTVPKAPVTISIATTFMFQNFPITKQGRGTNPSVCFLSNLLGDQPGQAKSIIRQILYFVDCYKVQSSGRDKVIRLYLKIPQEYVRLILLYWF